MLKNKEGKTPRLLAKDNEHKDALKECRKAEKQSAKLAKGGSRTGEPYAIRVSLYLTLILPSSLTTCRPFATCTCRYWHEFEYFRNAIL